MTVKGTPSAEPIADAGMKSAMAKQRQALLMKRMQQKQSNFTANEPDVAEETSTAETEMECAMCRESSLQGDDIFVAIGFCSGGNSIARTVPRSGSSLAFPTAPYVNACLHVVHRSCWQTHLEASTERPGQPDLLFLNRPLEGEVQCPVCRSLSNIVIPIVSPTGGEPLFEAIVDLGSKMLETTIKSSSAGMNVELWLERDSPCWRPFMFSSFLDTLAEATYNELLLSTSLAPSKVLSSNSLHCLLVRCMQTALNRSSRPNDWRVWGIDPKEALRVDCARLFLESGKFSDRMFIEEVLALRFLQFQGGDTEVLDREMTSLGLIISWIVSSMEIFSTTDLNRIAFLPEDPKEGLSVIEQVLGVHGWRNRVQSMQGLLGSSLAKGVYPPVAPHGKLVSVGIPDKLTDLIKETVGRICMTCGTAPNEPALCLLCNEIVCLDSDCCRSSNGEGECTSHAQQCGAGQGLFLLPYASIVVAVGYPRNCIWDGPYVDSHGEPDSYLKRSCQLRLSRNKLDQMRLAYTRGTIPVEIVKQNQVTGRYVPRQL